MSKSNSASEKPLHGQAQEIMHNVASHLEENVYKLPYNVVDTTTEVIGETKLTV